MQGGAFGGVQEAGDHPGVHAGGIGYIDQLVIGGDAFRLGVEAAPLAPLQRQLVQLEIAKGADDGIDLT